MSNIPELNITSKKNLQVDKVDSRSLTKIIKDEILSHARLVDRGEGLLLCCTADCLAKSITTKVHYDIESAIKLIGEK